MSNLHTLTNRQLTALYHNCIPQGVQACVAGDFYAAYYYFDTAVAARIIVGDRFQSWDAGHLRAVEIVAAERDNVWEQYIAPSRHFTFKQPELVREARQNGVQVPRYML